jgi:hypothetical protein
MVYQLPGAVHYPFPEYFAFLNCVGGSFSAMIPDGDAPSGIKDTGKALYHDRLPEHYRVSYLIALSIFGD